MKTHKQLGMGLLVALTVFAASMAVYTVRLHTRYAKLEASHLALQGKHRLLKEGCMQLAQSPAIDDQTFRKLLTVLDREDGADITAFPSLENSAPVNQVPATGEKFRQP